jgi:hypothetical protein
VYTLRHVDHVARVSVKARTAKASGSPAVEQLFGHSHVRSERIEISVDRNSMRDIVAREFVDSAYVELTFTWSSLSIIRSRVVTTLAGGWYME